ASVQNSAGETVAQTVIQDKDKVNPSQPVGQPAQEATTNNAVVGNTQTGNQAVGNTEVTPSAPEQTPVQPDNNVNQGEQTTPSTPENNGNTGENQPSNPGNGGTTTPEQPNQPGGGNTDKPSTPSNEYDPMTPVGSLGLFKTQSEAESYGLDKARELELTTGKAYRVQTWEVLYTDGRVAGYTGDLVPFN
ncbi:peptidoglycan-binding protein, partial [Enterococcus faecalis]|uniref:peptidoglycan-binding protein n=1 Tax=Enterococcus faecalis TaxID=1351 RepID=UPI000879059B